MLKDYISEELIFLEVESQNRPDLFRYLSEYLQGRGYVTQGFYDFLSRREDNYPTGLELEGYNVAIPHGDPEFIKKPFIAIIRLINPIQMHRMDDPTLSLPVSLLFVLGLDSGGNHLMVLKNILALIQEESFIEKLMAVTTPQEAVQLLIQ